MKSRHFHPGVPARGEIRAVASREEDVRVCRFPDCFIKNEFALQISPASFHFRCQAGGALQVVVQYAYLHPVRSCRGAPFPFFVPRHPEAVPFPCHP